jgi:hypothetical protein
MKRCNRMCYTQGEIIIIVGEMRANIFILKTNMLNRHHYFDTSVPII